MSKIKYANSSFDDLLEETGDRTEVSAVAIKRVIAWQVSQKMENEKISKTRMGRVNGDQPISA